MKDGKRFTLRIPEKPVDLWKGLTELARRNHGSINREIVLAIEDRLINEGVFKDWRATAKEK